MQTGQFDVRSEVRRQQRRETRPRSPAKTAEAMPASFRVSTAAEIRSTYLRSAHRPSSLRDDLTRLTSVDAVVALKWFGGAAALCAVIIASIFSLMAIAEESAPPPNDLELPDTTPTRR
jgi:hypothetical protein